MLYLVLTWLMAPLWWCVGIAKQFGRSQRPIQKIMLVQTAKIGDFVATSASFRALKMIYPTAQLHVLLAPVNKPLAKQLTGIDCIHCYDAQQYRGFSGKLKTLRLFLQQFDAIIILSPNLAFLLCAFWAGIPHRLSVLPDRRRGSARLAYPFLTATQAHQTGRQFRETALRLLTQLPHNEIDNARLLQLPNEVALSLSPSTDKKLHALFARLDTDRQGEQNQAQTSAYPSIGLGIGAGNRMKAFSFAQWQKIIHGLLSASPAYIVLIGTAQDQAVAEALVKAFSSPRILNATGQFTLAELPSLLAKLSVFAGVDSGATYIADALAVPVVDFMGPADAQDQRPQQASAVILLSQEPCAPCSHTFDAPYTCALNTRACVNNAPLDDFIKAILSRL